MIISAIIALRPNGIINYNFVEVYLTNDVFTVAHYHSRYTSIYVIVSFLLLHVSNH